MSGTSSPASPQPQVLLAEDNPVNAAVISRQLSALGYTCTIAQDGELAWALLQAGDFVALLTDCEMPLLDGYGLARRVRATPAYAALPLIAMSGRPDSEQQARCRLAGMDACLGKPVSTQALADALAHPRRMATPESSTVSGLDALRALYPNPGALATVLTLFVSNCHKDIPQMEHAYQRRAPEPFGRVAHRLVGSLQLLDQQDLARELAQWHRSGALPPAPEYARLRRQLDAFVDRVYAAVQQLRAPN